MKISVIVAHPFEQSFNHGLATKVCAALLQHGHRVQFHDLCAEEFNPVMTRDELGSDTSEDPLVLAYMDELRETDGVVVIHPNWWGQPPAIMKGWVDRVLRNGFAYRFGKRADGTHGPMGLLPIKSLLVLTTSNTPNDIERTVEGDTLQHIWGRYVSGFLGIPRFERRNFSVVVSSTQEQRETWIQEAIELALSAFK